MNSRRLRVEDREFELAWGTETHPPHPPQPKSKRKGWGERAARKVILSGFISKRSVVSNRKKETKTSGQSKRGGVQLTVS